MIDEEFVDKVGFTREDHRNIEKSRNLNIQLDTPKTEEEKKQEEKVFNKKLNAFRAMLVRMEGDLNRTFNKLGINIGPIKIDGSFSAGKSDRELVTKLSFFQNDNGKSSVGVVNMNMNIKKLLKYPSLELYALVSSSVLKSVLGKDGNKVQDVIYKSGKTLEDVNKGQSLVNSEINREKARRILKRYIKTFLNENFNDSVFEVSFITDSILDSLSDENIKKLMHHNFDNVVSKDGLLLDDALDKHMSIKNYRIQALHKKIFDVQLNIEGVSSSEVNAYREQELALSNVFLKGKFNKAKESILSGNSSDLMSYCESFASAFCQSHGINAPKINFVNKKNARFLGQYHDLGSGGQYIDINLGRVDNIIDLSTTLTHELTHAIESSLNKSRGATNNDGTGLLNDMSEDISHSGLAKGTAEYNLLKEINNYCYYVNPNERNARQNEVSAYAFMVKFADDDPILKAQLSESIQGKVDPKTGKKYGGYIQYLEKTQEYLENIDKSIEKFQNRFNALNVPESSKGYVEISERINYLKTIKSIFEKDENSKGALDSAKAILDSLGASATEQNDKSENRAMEKFNKENEINAINQAKEQEEKNKKNKNNVQVEKVLEEINGFSK